MNQFSCKFPIALLLLTAVLLAFVPAAVAQEVSASITGVVTDPTSATIASAAVTVRDLERGTVYPTQTNEAGIYFYPRVPAGRYELKVEAQGFKSAVRSDIVL